MAHEHNFPFSQYSSLTLAGEKSFCSRHEKDESSSPFLFLVCRSAIAVFVRLDRRTDENIIFVKRCFFQPSNVSPQQWMM